MKIALIIVGCIILALIAYILFFNHPEVMNQTANNLITTPTETALSSATPTEPLKSLSPSEKANRKQTQSTSSANSNQATQNCTTQGGTVELKKKPNGETYAICMFEDDQECEVWALYWGECPVGGVKTIGFNTTEQVYCAISGGQITATAGAKCTLPGGTVCPARDFFLGTCD